MRVSRRTMVLGAAAAAAPFPAFAQRVGGGWYDRAIVIDALGGIGDPYAEGVLRLSDRAWAETLATGVTMVRDTVFPVGNVVGVYFMPFRTRDSQPRGDDLVRHIEHVANIAGEDHVGIGTDNGVLPIAIDEESRKHNWAWNLERSKAGIAAPGEGPDVFPIIADYNSVDRDRRLADVLGRRGWWTTRLEKLFGANFLRVYRDAWEA